jgi:hypothetical protein
VAYARARMSSRAPILATLAAILLTSATAGAVKRRFEPTDLDLAAPGTMGVDLQLGLVQSDGPLRLVLPDAELNLGLASNVEIDVDFSFGVEGPANGAFAFDHTTTDNMWIAAKLGLLALRDPAAGTAWALGLQLGPKVPLSRDAVGAGYEALFLVGCTTGQVHLGLNLGGLIDPGAEVSRRRPVGVVMGVDAQLDVTEQFTVLGGLGAVLYVSANPHALEGTLGLQWSPTETLDVSLLGLVGLPPGSDRYGVFVGVAKTFQLWK